MMRKKSSFINVTPIPSFIPRQLAIDMLHSHEEVIKTNPLVLEVKPTKAPRDATADEFYSTWYEIFERVQLIPGAGKMGSSKISFKACFHDMPWGLQTHTYAPMDIDMRNKWQICGNQQGEPAVAQELGIGAPAEGLYLREDIEIKCNFTMISFVKKEMKAASKVMVDRMIKKAELLDSGALQMMFEDGKLKTVNPADRTENNIRSPRPESVGTYQNPLRSPTAGYYPNQPQSQPQNQYQSQHQSQHHGQSSAAIPMELPGDMYFAGQQQQSQAHLNPHGNDRYSMASSGSGRSPVPNDGAWSENQSNHSSRPTSYASDGMRSPGHNQNNFVAELPTHEETVEHRTAGAAPTVPPKVDNNQGQHQPYNSQDFGNHRHSNPASQKWQEAKRDTRGSQRMIFP